MKNKVILLPVLMIFFNSCRPIVKKNFYKDYKNARLLKDRRIINDNLGYRAINLHIKRIREAFKSVEMQTKVSMLEQDTVFMFLKGYPGLGDTVIGSWLVWNKTQSCHYMEKVFPKSRWEQKQMYQLGPVTVPANEDLKQLTPEFKTFTEKADTVGFAQYMKSNRFSGDFTYSFIVAYRVQKHWKFVFTPAYATGPVRHY